MKIPNHPIPGRLWIVHLAELVSNRVRSRIQNWPANDRDRLGDQLLRSIDSIGVNIAEGYARFHVRERLHFYSIAQGSIEESIRHITRARHRGLLSPLESFTFFELLVKLSKSLDRFGDKQTSRI